MCSLQLKIYDGNTTNAPLLGWSANNTKFQSRTNMFIVSYTFTKPVENADPPSFSLDYKQYSKFVWHGNSKQLFHNRVCACQNCCQEVEGMTWQQLRGFLTLMVNTSKK